MRRKLFSIIFLLCMIAASSYAQQDVNGWFWLNGQPTGNSLKWVKIVNSANFYAIGDRGTFMKSTDGGDSWSINSQVGAPDVSSTGNLAARQLNSGWFFDANTGIVAGQSVNPPVGVAPGVISRTTDGGNTWNYISYNDSVGSVNKIQFINSLTGYLTGSGRARFFKTTDGGLSWTDQSYGGQYFTHGTPSNTYSAMWAIDTSHIFLGIGTRFIYTHLPGQDSAWKKKQLPGTVNATITDIYFIDANTGYVCGNANYFAYTLDGGNTWTQSLVPVASGGQFDFAYDAGVLYMAGTKDYIYKTVNNGVTWDSIYFQDGSNVNQPSNTSIAGVDVNGNDMAVVTANGKVNISNDGGATWRNKNYSVNPGTTTYSSILVEPLAGLDASVSGRIWVGPNGGGNLLYSTNGGVNWTTQTTSHITSIFAIDFVNSTTGYIGGGNAFGGIGQMSKTTDGGNTWNLLTLDPTMSSQQINSVDFVNANTGWACGGASAFGSSWIFKTTDGGATWSQQTLTPAATGLGVSVQMVNENIGYFKNSNTVNQLYYTSDGGNTWTRNTTTIATTINYSNMFVLNKDIIYLNGFGAPSGGDTINKVVRSDDGGNTWTDLTGNLLGTFTAFRSKWLNLKHGIVSGTNGYMAKTTDGGLNWTASNPGFSTTVDCAIPEKNTWFTVCDRNSSYQVGRKLENLTSISLNVTMGIEGFWEGKPMVRDTVTAQLRSSTSPYGIVEQSKEYVTGNGYATHEFYTAPTGSYYIALRHRNSIETWSSNTVAMNSGGNYNYDFTTASSQAYGNNTVLKLGIYCDYSGDVNQDGIIDVSDINDVYNNQLVSGYVTPDVNGDDFVDVSDLLITYNNALNVITVMKP